MSFTLTHAVHHHLDLAYNEKPLFRYHYKPDLTPTEVIKPYFHPLYTLDGNLVTNFRPYDHPWHHGLAMTMAVLSEGNFWGGPSYVHGEGYVKKANHGRMAHQDWKYLRCEQTTAGWDVRFKEHLHWIGYDERLWLDEERTMTISEINPDQGYWTLDHHICLQNTRGETLRFGSPTTEGRPAAGYGSLFWRGPRSFFKGNIMAGGGLEGPDKDIMGQAAPWLSVTGWHDGSCQQSTLLFVDHPQNPRYPTKWFIRHDPYVTVSYAFSFDEEYPLPPDEVLTLSYRLVLINGAWERGQIEAYLADTNWR